MRKLTFVVLAVVLALIVLPTIVRADPWSAIDSGYAITTNHFGEVIIPPPDPPLEARVGVLEEIFDSLTVYEVRVDLRDPSGEVVDSYTIPAGDFTTDAPWGTSPKGATVMWAETDPMWPGEDDGVLAADAPWVVGDYSVKAYFLAVDGKVLAQTDDLTAMRATTVMIAPEIPIGTVAILLTMLASLAIFTRKRY